MMNADVEMHISQNYPWSKLPQSVKQLLGDSQREYEKHVIHFSIKNQLRYRGNIVRTVKRDEKIYYEELLKYGQEHLMLYPYHLSDFIVSGMRITPFQYYINMMQDLMEQEKSYDALPNFTAADCLRLLGIGRNQYIDLMNQCRSKTIFGARRKPIRELLPSKPVTNLAIEPWWHVQVGYVTEDDIRVVSQGEKLIIDKIIDNGAQRAGDLNVDDVKALYRKGLVYLDVPIVDDDYIIVPPLEGFVMNRVLGDYFETLLYKIFVSIDEHTTVSELSGILQIDLSLVKNAVSMYCRLGIAHKKGQVDQHNSWKVDLCDTSKKKFGIENFILPPDDDDFECDSADIDINHPQDVTSEPLLLNTAASSKRIGFLFDSTLTAYLMMGNLSPGLKRHAVTMFEVGKLSDESLDSFLMELLKVADVGEGEARRYFDHALTLRSTILFLRNNPYVLPIYEKDGNGIGLDLIRCESLQHLEEETCTRLLKKNYKLLISMAPLSNEIRPVSSYKPPHLGPPIPEVNSIWFKFFLYSVLKHGPTSLLLARGTRLHRMPKMFWNEEKLLVTTWSHDPSSVPASNALPTINDALCHSPVLIQKQARGCEFMYVSFPLIGEASKTEFPFVVANHPAILALSDEIDLVHTVGYVTMIRVTETFFCKSTGNSRDVKNAETSIHSASFVKDIKNTEISVEFGAIKSVSSASFTQNCSERVFSKPLSDKKLNLLEFISSKKLSDCDDDDKNWFPVNEDVYDYSNKGYDWINDWTILDCTFGIPLFDNDLNKNVCQKIIDKCICNRESLQYMVESNERMCLKVLDFISKYHGLISCSDHGQNYLLPNQAGYDFELPLPSRNLLFCDGELSVWDGV